MSQTILIVEDEEIARKNVAAGLARDAFDVVEAKSGSEALAALRTGGIDLVLLDVGLPDCCGFQLLHEIRLVASVPVIFMTARDNEQDRVVGLEQGADDYISKPFFLRELIARVRAVIRRAYGPMLTPIAASDGLPLSQLFELNPERHEVIIQGHSIDLTPGEFGILKTLSDRPGIYFTRDKLLNVIAKDIDAPTDRVIDTHIKNLRSKLKEASPDIEFISTRWGLGYSFQAHR